MRTGLLLGLGSAVFLAGSVALADPVRPSVVDPGPARSRSARDYAWIALLNMPVFFAGGMVGVLPGAIVALPFGQDSGTLLSGALVGFIVTGALASVAVSTLFVGRPGAFSDLPVSWLGSVVMHLLGALLVLPAFALRGEAVVPALMAGAALGLFAANWAEAALVDAGPGSCLGYARPAT